jgi:hypothetical protein
MIKSLKYGPSRDLGIGKVVNQIRGRIGNGGLWRIMVTDIPKSKVTQDSFEFLPFRV